MSLLLSAKHFAGRHTLAVALLLSVVVVNAALLYPELHPPPDKNDNISHFALISQIAQALERGANPLDFWSPEWCAGYPIVRVYQSLSHMLVALTWLLTGKKVALMTVFVCFRYLVLVAMPVSFFACALLLRLPPMTAAAAALLSPLLATDTLYGLDYASYLWSGRGLFAQALAAHFLLWTLGLGFRAVCRGGSSILAGTLLACAFLAHFIYGYIGALSIALLILVPDMDTTRLQRLRRAGGIWSIAVLLSAFQLATLVKDAPFLNHSAHEAVWKFDSHGAAKILTWLFTGKLMDSGRLPVLTLLALGGLLMLARSAFVFRRLRTARAWILCAVPLWILLYFGRATWGPLFSVLGLPPDAPTHRFLGAVHIFLLLAAAIALSALWNEFERRVPLVVAAGLVAIILAPAIWERTLFLSTNASQGRQAMDHFLREDTAIDEVAAIARTRGGRLYDRGPYDILPIYSYLGTRGIPVVPMSLYAVPLTMDVLWNFADANPEYYRLFNVHTAVDTSDQPPLPFLTQLAARGRFRVFAAPASGYFDLVNVAAAARTDRRTFSEINDVWLKSPWLAQRAHIWLDFDGAAPFAFSRVFPGIPLPPAPQPPSGSVFERGGPDGAFVATYETAKACTLLFKMSWHPNWKAELDGKPVATIMLSPGLTGVPVPAGRHEVVLRYQPEAQRPIMAVSGIVLTLGLALGRLWRSTRNRHR